MAHQLLGLGIFLVTLALVVVRPCGLSEAIAAVLGALAMVVLGFVGPSDALAVLVGEWNVFCFFLGLMLIAAIADRAGVFDVLALGAARLAGGETSRLYLAVFAIGALITAILSNDATALILTPVIYTLATRLRIAVLPFMFACTFIADTASFLLPVANPINILVLNRFGIGLGPFLWHLLPAALLCVGLNVLVFRWRFRRDLRGRYDLTTLGEALPAPVHQPFFRFVAAALAGVAAGYLLASAWQWPLGLVALAGSVVLLAGAAWYGQLDGKALGREVSWSIFPFIGGMFVLVRGVELMGLTQAFGAFILGLGGTSRLGAIISTATGTALGANLINNVPMALVMSSALGSQSGLATPIHTGAIYATILGADLGPNLTTVGSLATMLWLLILRRKGVDISTWEYLKLGLTVVPAMLAGGALLIWLMG